MRIATFFVINLFAVAADLVTIKLGLMRFNNQFLFGLPPYEIFAWGAYCLSAIWLLGKRPVWVYVAYMLALGTVVELVGVHTGQWTYPGAGGVAWWYPIVWGLAGYLAGCLTSKGK